MKEIAIITGDIVNSRAIANKATFLNVLRIIFKEIEAEIPFLKPFEIYRGDSFQAMVRYPKDAMRVALLVRAGLRSMLVLKNGEKELPLDQIWDARIAVGIGGVDFISKKITASDGEAFVLSGEALDSMKKSDERLKIVVVDKAILKTLFVTTTLVNTIINRWSNYAAQVMYRYLLYNETQKQMAKALAISQPAIHKRKVAANADAVVIYLDFISQLIQNKYE